MESERTVGGRRSSTVVTGPLADPWSATATADLASRDDEGTPPPYIARALTFLAAAAAPGRWTHVSTHLDALLTRDPSLAIAAGGAALAEAIDMDVLEAIEAHLPSGRHVDLDPAAAAITTRLHAHRLASATGDDERARLHATLGYRLANASRPEEARAAGAEAAEIYRRLAAARPAAFEPELARGLWGYAWVRAAGKADLAQALTAAEEAVTRYEALASRRPLAFTNDLAGALTTLADVLDGLDRTAAAAAAAARRRAEELGAT